MSQKPSAEDAEFAFWDRELQRRKAALEAWTDPVAFARSVHLEPYPWQERVLRWEGKRLLLNCCRQAGKSTTTSVLALYRAVTKPRSLVLLISPSLRQSAELFRKVLDALGEMKRRPKMLEENKLSLRLENGSRIISLPSSEATIRGFSSVSLIVEDEAAFVGDDLYTACRPMLIASAGAHILMSTPNGRRGHFFEAWERGGDVWDRIEVQGYDCPHISREDLEADRAILGERFEQEYCCKFINAATGRVYLGFDEQRNVIAEAPKLDHVGIGLDFGVVDQNGVTVAGWRKHDPTVYVLESYRITAGPSEMAAEVKKLSEAYKPAWIVGDVGGMGKAYEHEFRTVHGIPLQPAEKQNKVGFIGLVNDALRAGRIKVVRDRCKQLTEEWLTLPWADSLDDRRENRQREADGYDNHAADSCLYLWRRFSAHAETPKAQPIEPDSPEYYAMIQKKLEDEAQQQYDEQKREEELLARYL